jgi:hypothetical protein
MKNPQVRMWFATKNVSRGMLRFLWRDVRIAVRRPARRRPPTISRGTWSQLSNMGRERAKREYLLEVARRTTNSADIRRFMVPALTIEPNRPCYHPDRAWVVPRTSHRPRMRRSDRIM